MKKVLSKSRGDDLRRCKGMQRRSAQNYDEMLTCPHLVSFFVSKLHFLAPMDAVHEHKRGEMDELSLFYLAILSWHSQHRCLRDK